MPTARTRTRNNRPTGALRLDAIGGWSVLGSLAFHGALLGAAVALAAMRPAPEFVPGEARAPAGVSVPVGAAQIEDFQEAPAPQIPAAAASRRAASVAEPIDARVTAPAALVDAASMTTEFEPATIAPLPAAAGLRDAPAMRSAPAVFGVSGQREADRVVYLVDASGSMVAALPAVLEEVARSIDALAPDQRFTVGVFGAGGVRSPESLASRGERLVRATESNKAAIRRWLSAIDAQGAGDALTALRWGLEQRPDIVFIMAKGITDRGQAPDQREASAERFLREVERLNPADARGLRPVRIRAIEFFDPDASRLLERLGAAHGAFGGEPASSGHRFISRREMGLE